MLDMAGASAFVTPIPGMVVSAGRVIVPVVVVLPGITPPMVGTTIAALVEEVGAVMMLLVIPTVGVGIFLVVVVVVGAPFAPTTISPSHRCDTAGNTGCAVARTWLHEDPTLLLDNFNSTCAVSIVCSRVSVSNSGIARSMPRWMS